MNVGGKLRRVLVLGASGLLGRYVVNEALQEAAVVVIVPRSRSEDSTFSPGVDAVDIEFDASAPGSLLPLFRAVAPDIVVNCVVNKGKAESLEATHRAVNVNGVFPHCLAETAAKFGAHIIHLSTDAVFSGARGNYNEGDVPDPLELYGWTKLVGELNRPGCITLRTTFIGLSERSPNLLSWFFEQAEAGRTIMGHSEYHLSGVYAGRLARYIRKLICMDAPPSGLFHVGGEAWTKFWLLDQLSRRLGLPCTVEKVAFPAINRTLDSTRFFTLLGEPRPSAEQLLDDLCSELLDVTRSLP